MLESRHLRVWCGIQEIYGTVHFASPNQEGKHNKNKQQAFSIIFLHAAWNHENILKSPQWDIPRAHFPDRHRAFHLAPARTSGMAPPRACQMYETCCTAREQKKWVAHTHCWITHFGAMNRPWIWWLPIVDLRYTYSWWFRYDSKQVWPFVAA